MHTGIGTDTHDSGRGELHLEERIKIAKLWGIQLTPKVLTGYYEERRLRIRC
jgi:hypothetical protein